MREASYLATVAVVGSLALLFSDTGQTAADDQLEGSWEVVSLSRDGVPVPALESYTGILIYEDKIVFSNPRGDARTLKYRLGRGKTHKRLDVYDEQGRKLLKSAVYEVRKDELQICFGQPRPTTLETKKGDGRELCVLRRRSKE